MAKFGAFTLVLAALALSGVHADGVDPIAKVLQMIGDLQGKIISEGNDAQKVYDEFSEFCEDRSRELGFEIKTGKQGVKDLTATIEDEKAKAASLNAKIEELSSAISVDEADLKAATDIRNKENAAFVAEEKELVDVIGTVERAIGILEKELAKTGSASMMQLQSATSVVSALAIMVDATSLSSADSSKLAALLQNTQESEDDSMGAPAAAVYKGKSGGIVETMQDLYEKGEAQLEEARKAESKSLQAFQMLAQSLKDEIKYGQQDLDKAKKSLGASAEAQATAEGDLSVTSADLAEDEKALSTLHQDCMTGAEDFEAETKSRGEELHALATAKKIIAEATSGAADQSYSFLQTQLASGADLAKFEAVRFVRDLARKQHSNSLAQLAAKMTSAMHTSGGDQFQKVKGLIRDMIAKLESEQEADATRKMWCDRNLADTRQRKSEKEAEIAKLTTRIDSMSTRSAQLKSEVAALQEGLANLAQAQAQMNKLRGEEKATFEANKADLEKGLQGLKLAIQILNEYYATPDKAHEAADGAASGIIGLLEVCESDFTQDLARVTADEETAVAEYEKMTKANEIERTTKIQDVRYKTKEFKRLDADTAELNSDRSTVQTELDATNEALSKLEEQCIDRAETFAERKARFAAEIAGLKQALSILENETALLQQHAAHHKLRGSSFA